MDTKIYVSISKIILYQMEYNEHLSAESSTNYDISMDYVEPTGMHMVVCLMIKSHCSRYDHTTQPITADNLTGRKKKYFHDIYIVLSFSYILI